MSKKILRSSAAALLDTLSTFGVERVFANAGTDFAPVIEALSAFGKIDRPAPEFVAVPHETVAVAMGHGQYAASGKTPVVMVHTTVGTSNAAMGVINAARDHIPLVLLAGRTPLTDKGNEASRSGHIHWGQEAFDQAGMLREYLKWDYELRSGQSIENVLARAFQIANTHPKGPVYVTLPREVLATDAVAGLVSAVYAKYNLTTRRVMVG
jgi:acetolactate synthase-1/2/3 large subunit